MSKFWMVRAGEGGYLFPEFERTGRIGIDWEFAGDFTEVTTLEAMKVRVAATDPTRHPSALANSASMAFKFRVVMQKGDRVVTYDPQSRQYLMGTIVGDYEYGERLKDSPHTRRVEWRGRVSRDVLRPASRNTLGSTLTVFEPGEDVLADLVASVDATPGPASPQVALAREQEFEIIRRDTLGRAHEFIKDRILQLDPDEMEQLIAGLLRAMGFKARVTPKGADRGRDVIASPDGLGLQQPRIFAEVKHRPGSPMGSGDVRSFSGGLREGDRGLYVSTGGFSREARYEADRASVPVTLVDLDELARLVVEHYESFDTEGRQLIPLIRVYWPIGE